jgi:soluble lytic murein transglycosylase-like protein
MGSFYIPNPNIPIALAWSESGFDSKAISSSNCRGLFQLSSKTAIYICKKYKIKYNKNTIRKDLLNNVWFNVQVGEGAELQEFETAFF